MRQGLRKDLRRPQIPRNNRQPLPIPQRRRRRRSSSSSSRRRRCRRCRGLTPIFHPSPAHPACQPLDRGSEDVVVDGPDELACVSVHACDGDLLSELHHDRALIIPDGHFIRVPRSRQRPHPLHPIVESRLRPIRRRMPDSDSPILAPRDDDRQAGVEQHRSDIMCVPLQRLHAGLGLIVPDTHLVVISAGEEVGLVPPGVVVDAVHALLVA